MQAAVLREKLHVLDEWNDRRRLVASQYLEALAGTSLILPVVPAWAEPVWHLFVVRSSQRDALRHQLTSASIGTLIHYPIPPHLQQCYSAEGSDITYPITESVSSQLLSLPIGPNWQT